jgi:hypothetical protein
MIINILGYVIISISIVFFLHFIYKFIYDSIFIEEQPLHAHIQDNIINGKNALNSILNNNEKMGLHNIEGYNKQPGSVEKQQYKNNKEILKKDLKNYMKGLANKQPIISKNKEPFLDNEPLPSNNITMLDNIGNTSINQLDNTENIPNEPFAVSDMKTNYSMF